MRLDSSIERLAGLRRRLKKAGVGGFFSLAQPDNQYLTGFMGSASAVVATPREALFLCDFRYTEQAAKQVAGYTVEEVTGSLIARTGERLAKLGVKRAAFDPGVISVGELDAVQRAFGGTLVPLPNAAASLRLVKDREEVRRIRAASHLAEGVMLDLVKTLRPGLEERELAAQFEYEFKRRGAEGASFDTIALFGSRSSMPHGRPGWRALKRGDIVLLDLGCRKAGYCSDLTRTYVFDRIPGAWFSEIYAVTLAAQRAALKAVRPGARCRDVDAAARSIISDAGYGTRFGHGLGHGVGIEIHENPRLNTESDTVLEEGMVVTVEPGIYLPKRGGVRIEDLVVVTKRGCEILTSSSKELVTL